MNKKIVLGLVVSLIVYANLFAQSERDFQITINAGRLTITGYTGNVADIRIPVAFRGMPVLVIGDNAFSGIDNRGMIKNNRLTSVTIPDSVTIIGARAFAYNDLTNVTIPNNVTIIGDAAFLHNKLTSVIIPDSVISIGANAFDDNMQQLTNITIGNSVTSIGARAFAANRLTSVIIPDSVTTIGEEAFIGNGLISVTIGNSVTSIGARAFAGNGLTRVTIPNSVTSIEEYAFLNAFAEGQISITIGTNVTIAENAIQNNFAAFYNTQGRAAGTYNFRNGRWSRQ